MDANVFCFCAAKECKINLSDEKPCAAYTGLSVAGGAIGAALAGIVLGVGVSVVVFGPCARIALSTTSGAAIANITL